MTDDQTVDRSEATRRAMARSAMALPLKILAVQVVILLVVPQLGVSTRSFLEGIEPLGFITRLQDAMATARGPELAIPRGLRLAAVLSDLAYACGFLYVAIRAFAVRFTAYPHIVRARRIALGFGILLLVIPITLADPPGFPFSNPYVTIVILTGVMFALLAILNGLAKTKGVPFGHPSKDGRWVSPPAP